jgi:hypothetical protein
LIKLPISIDTPPPHIFVTKLLFIFIIYIYGKIQHLYEFDICYLLDIIYQMLIVNIIKVLLMWDPRT